ncbi:TonB-dependent receptor [Sphingomonas psychrotolerans]|uniref:TonB-dependent receptor n=1 Tax=Sphingomonas psychrotolerans TaxID=1327635 RepID=A0ABU3N8Q5_9SPHN|nr:TonB-dependent receptor [Sphingomonas psychrotolerans]MDT8760172.1 TonB-dependent receptor [Sphingomonas psychrotolerans]
MKRGTLFLAAAPLVLAAPAFATTISGARNAPDTDETPAASQPNQDAGKPQEEVFSTGVAKGRDRLDSATSTSAIKDRDVEKLAPRSLADILRTIPGIRVEGSSGDGNSNYTIRGLPLASGGSKYMQIEEDGLPVLEFGDFFGVASDIFIRADANLAQVEAIRGGSASTFASNSPGGVINLISKTGEVEGGAIHLSTGLDYDEQRIDFDYGAKLSDTLRFHFGGFYRTGEGVRNVGFNAVKGGQLKFNLTKQFSNGFIRLNGKLLDDRSPQYVPIPIRISGTNDKPVLESVPGLDVRSDSLLSRNISGIITLDGNNLPARYSIKDGMHALVKSIGLEAQFDIAGWTVSERMRYSAISGGVVRGQLNANQPVNRATILANALGGAGARLSYASGPLRGQPIADPASLNGNGLLANNLLTKYDIHSLDNFSNDLRGSRVWNLGSGDLTVTGGVYKSVQTLNTDWLYTNTVQDVVGGGNASLIDITNAAGVVQTVDGFYAFNLGAVAGLYRRTFDVDYDVTAPYGSVNYHIGKVSIGGSIRYDAGKVRGQLIGAELGGGRIGMTSFDFNNDGRISPAETRTGILPLSSPAPVNYDYGYLSYSTGINFRVAEPLAVFARYSRGARANADKILFTSAVSTTTGELVNDKDGYDVVTQAEAGVKFRKSNLTLNLTGFLANTNDTNLQTGGVVLKRKYRAYGAELEGAFREGPFSLTANATYTHAEIREDLLNTALNGSTPRHQPDLIYNITPQVDTRFASFGANISGSTESYAQDVNQLKMPGFTLVDAFVQFRPTERLQLMLNANNLFDKVAFYEIQQNAIPASGYGWGRAANGRTISATASLSF